MNNGFRFNKHLVMSGLLIFFLFTFALSASAVTVAWTGGGSDNLASNPANWSGNTTLQNGDNVIFDNSSAKNCLWSLDITLAFLTLDAGYSGAVTLNSPLRITGNLTISGGLFNQNNQTLLIGFSPPAATTDSAISTNGNSATLNATVNPNGLDTTVYFECRTGTSYDISTAPQLIGNGTSNISVSANTTNLSPNTVYYCKVVVTNSFGTIYGNDTSFTTSPITLTIISPVNGGTINRPDILVRGSVTNTTGNETGVTVNGITTTTYNGEFFANHVPLADGSNIINVNAVDTGSNAVNVSTTVNAVTSMPHITLKANIESGTSPLYTYFSISTEITNAAATYQMDFEGDGTVDYTTTTFENLSHTYMTNGIYSPTVTVTDDQGISYSNTIAVIVLNMTEMDSLLRNKWMSMTGSLSNNNATSALTYISSVSRTSYQAMFSAILDQLPSIMSTQTGFNLISIKNNAAKYELITSENGTTYSYEVTFIKDTNGLWMIMKF
jgi:hypothetical protein